MYFILWDSQKEVEFALSNVTVKLPEPHKKSSFHLNLSKYAKFAKLLPKTQFIFWNVISHLKFLVFEYSLEDFLVHYLKHLTAQLRRIRRSPQERIMSLYL